MALLRAALVAAVAACFVASCGAVRGPTRRGVLAPLRSASWTGKGKDGERSWPAPLPGGGEDLVAKKFARFIGDAEVAARVLKWFVVLCAGGFRFGWRVASEVCGRALYRTVVVVEMKGVIADDRSARCAGAGARYWCWGGGGDLPFEFAPPSGVAAAAKRTTEATSMVGDGVISVSRCERALEKAFRHRRARAIVLKINSPGGTASESALLYAHVASLKARARAKHDAVTNRLANRVLRFVTRRRPEPAPEVLAFVDEICTSGGYFAACAADAIVATPCALLGSIGVIQGRTRVIQRRSNVGGREAIPDAKASTLWVRPER